MQRYTRLIAVVLFLVALWSVFELSGLRSHVSLQFIHDLFEENRLFGALVFAGLFALGNLVQIPGWLFLAAAVLALGQWWGGLVTYVAACLPASPPSGSCGCSARKRCARCLGVWPNGCSPGWTHTRP